MESTDIVPQRRFVSLRIKLVLGFTLVFNAVFVLTFIWFYAFASNSAMEQVRADLVGTLEGAIAGINGDDFARLTQASVPAGESVPRYNALYQRHQAWLDSIRRIEPNASPYTFVAGAEPYEVKWIGDIFRIIRPESQTAFRESYIADPANTQLYQGLTEQTVNMVPYTDKWGTWVSAYGPIKNSQGAVVGGLGIDYRADYVRQVQTAVRRQIWIAYLVALPLQLLLIWLLSGVVTNSLKKLTVAAARIGEGDYDQDLAELTDRRFPDEIATLAEVFAIMISKVRTREQSLIRQVAELRIEIDEVKQREQVSELTESDFFQDLTQKARNIRDRRR
ncbi:MAG: HAMP domain-containing protein [Caldilineaceae bacterium]